MIDFGGRFEELHRDGTGDAPSALDDGAIYASAGSAADRLHERNGATVSQCENLARHGMNAPHPRSRFCNARTSARAAVSLDFWATDGFRQHAWIAMDPSALTYGD